MFQTPFVQFFHRIIIQKNFVKLVDGLMPSKDQRNVKGHNGGKNWNKIGGRNFQQNPFTLNNLNLFS